MKSVRGLHEDLTGRVVARVGSVVRLPLLFQAPPYHPYAALRFPTIADARHLLSQELKPEFK